MDDSSDDGSCDIPIPPGPIIVQSIDDNHLNEEENNSSKVIANVPSSSSSSSSISAVDENQIEEYSENNNGHQKDSDPTIQPPELQACSSLEDSSDEEEEDNIQPPFRPPPSLPSLNVPNLVPNSIPTNSTTPNIVTQPKFVAKEEIDEYTSSDESDDKMTKENPHDVVMVLSPPPQPPSNGNSPVNNRPSIVPKLTLTSSSSSDNIVPGPVNTTPSFEISVTTTPNTGKQNTTSTARSSNSTYSSHTNGLAVPSGGRTPETNLAKRSLKLGDDFEQQSKYLFQVNEKGFVVSVAASILMEFQQYVENEFIESSKLIPYQVLAEMKEKKKEDVNFTKLFSFRNSEGYLKHLKLFKETTFEKSCQLYCQLLLDWLQSSTSEVAIPEWSYTRFTSRLIQKLNLSGEEKTHVLVQSINILIWLVVSDVFSIILKSYHPNIVDSHVTENIMGYCFDIVIFETHTNAKIYTVWKQMQSVINDQWAFVLRRLSRRNLTEVCSFFLSRVNKKVEKGLTKCYLQSLKYIDIDLTDSAGATRELLDTLLKLSEHEKIVKSSITLRNCALAVLQTVYSQLDFELEENCNLLEDFNLKVYNLANSFEKSKIGQKGSSKGESMILKSLIVKHATFQFHNNHASKLADEVIEFALKKKDQTSLLNQALYSLCVITKDKYNVDRNMSPFTFIGGPYSNKLLKNKPFVDLVYSETDKNISYFTEDQTSKSKYTEVMKKVLVSVQAFLQKLNVSIEAELFDTTSFFLMLLIMRIASHDIESVLGPDGIVRKYLSRDFQKNSLFSVAAFRVLKAMQNNAKDSYNVDVLSCESEIESIKRQSSFTSLLSGFKAEGFYLKKVLEHCNERMNVSILQYADFDLPVVKPENTITFIQDESDNDSDIYIFKSTSSERQDDNYSFNSSATSASTISDTDHNLSSASANVMPVSPRVRKLTKKGASETDIFKPLMRRKTATTSDFSNTLNRYPSVTSSSSTQASNEQQLEKRKTTKEEKLKKERYGLVKILIHSISTLPLFASEDILAYDKLENFLGNFLICGDVTIAQATSAALQETMKQHPLLRSSIIKKLTELLIYQLKQFDEVKSIKYLLKNIIQLIGIWSEDKANIDRSIDAWIFKLEAGCLISMCFVDRQLRLTALECLSVISNLFYEHVSGLSYRIIIENQSTIIQRSIRKIEVRDAMGVDEYIMSDDLLLKLERESLESVSQSETAATVLYTYILGFIGETLAEQNCKMYPDLLFLIKDFCIGVSELALEDEKYAPLWTDSLCLMSSLCGVPNPEDQNMLAALENYRGIVKNTLKQIDLFDKFLCSEEVWHHRAIVNICSCFNYQSLPTLMDILYSFLENKREKKVSVTTIIALKDIARILNSITQTQSFAKLVKYLSIFSQFLRQASDLIQKSYGILASERDVKIKDPFHLYCIFHSYANNAAALNNIAKTLFLTKNSQTRQKSIKITNALFLRNGNVWQEDARVNSINSLRECLDKITQMQQVADVTVERLKDEKAKEYWRGEYANILSVKLKHLCYRGISSILKVDPIPTLFSNSTFDYQTFFISSELQGYRMLDGVLCHHFEHLFTEFISTIYTTTDDDISEVYINAIYDNLLPSSTAFAPHYCTNEDRLEWMLTLKGQELFEGAPSFLNEDDIIHTVIQKNIFSILLLMLYLLNHPYDSVHSKAGEVVWALVHNNFCVDEVEKTINPTQKERVMAELEILDVSLRTNSTTLEYALRVSDAVSTLVSFWSNRLFLEAFKYLPTVAVTQRKSFLVNILKPWGKYLEVCPIPPPMDINEVIHVIIKFSLEIQRSIGVTKDLQFIWQEVCQQGGILMNPLAEQSNQIMGLDYSIDLKYPRNLVMIIDYIKALLSNAYDIEKDKKTKYDIETVCRGTALALFSVQPKLTLQLLLGNITSCDDNYGDAIMCLLHDIVCHNEHKTVVLEQAHIILVYALIRMDGMNEYAHNLFTSMLLSLMSHTSSQLLTRKYWLLLIKLLKDKVIVINWVDCLIDHQSSKLSQLDVESLVPFTTVQGSISAGYLIKILVDCIESSVGSSLVDHFAQHALEMATRETKNVAFIHNYLSIFYFSLHQTKSVSLTSSVLYRVLHCAYVFTESSDTNSTQASLSLANRVSNISNSEVLTDSKILALDVLHLIISRSSALDYKHVFWYLVSLLTATNANANNEYVAAIVDCLYVLKDNEACFLKYFLVDNEKVVKTELDRYIADRSWRGLIYILAEQIPNKVVQQKVLDLILIFMKANPSHMLDDVPDRKLFTILISLMPYFICELDSLVCQNLIKCMREELSSPLFDCFTKLETISPIDFSNKVCSELVKFFVNVEYAIHAADVLTNMYLTSTSRLRDSILLLVSSLVRYSPKEANAFALLYKLAITSDTSVASSFLSEVLNPAVKDFKQLLKYNSEDVQRLNDICKYTPKAIVDGTQQKVLCNRLKILVEESYGLSNKNDRPKVLSIKPTSARKVSNPAVSVATTSSAYVPNTLPIQTPRLISPSINPPSNVSDNSHNPTIPTNIPVIIPEHHNVPPPVDSHISIPLPDIVPEKIYSISMLSNPPPQPSSSSSPSLDKTNRIPDLANLLYNESYAMYFKNFALTKSDNTEALDFCVSALKYEKATDSIQRAVFAKRIVQQYVNQENSNVLNDNQKQAVLSKYRENVINPSTDLFSEIVTTVQAQLLDLYQQFLESSHCSELSNKIKNNLI
ncbi:hypothetical protein NAEGRDRAFT_79498 [Naegleria gruberi]|uniref:RGS domain-containing protein n=1 Tax=Naegleria gruberi TaxID=5762 RepID=D2VDF9_NAEGR|nr:uncharacterized protein NAEGRDRAFT_79498 [Naegleria gruberi]EFC45136.1 hypothetical protein NAEGRDRAFT_79498 [Naegleria gruberi]|eukprot:XP_002677880.1 hypothetical protein NAEGRDRAFT_79498 [Naegleria gruberi strain NEG-M]